MASEMRRNEREKYFRSDSLSLSNVFLSPAPRKRQSARLKESCHGFGGAAGDIDEDENEDDGDDEHEDEDDGLSRPATLRRRSEGKSTRTR